MNVIYIEEDDNKKECLKEKVKYMINKILGNVENKHIINDSYKNVAINSIIFRIPNYSFDKINKKFIKKLLYKIRQNNAKNIVLSKKLELKENFKNELNSYNYNVLDGRSIVKNSCIDIIKYVFYQAGSKLHEESISILVNDTSQKNNEIICDIARLVKNVNIITHNISYFKKIEKKLYEEEGIMISMGNNKKKGLLKSRYIVNIDFPEELIKKYKIYKRAVIINLENPIKSIDKSFLGVIVNDIQIKYNQTNEEIREMEKYEINKIYEAKTLALNSIDIKEVKNKDEFKIINTIGNNGIINNIEYKNLKKIN